MMSSTLVCPDPRFIHARDTDKQWTDYVPPRIYQAATIRYLVKGDDSAKDVIQIPGFATFFVKPGGDGSLRCYRAETFLDPSPVFQRMAEKGLLGGE